VEGYSGTPLSKKLGIVPPMTLVSTDAPGEYRAWLGLRKSLEESGFVWVSWPKKAAKVETDITEDTIREIALPLGFVDVKVCAVSEVWSGLKLVVRKGERTALGGRIKPGAT
jgi:hypothetical protein